MFQGGLWKGVYTECLLQVYLSVVWNGGKLAAAYYDAQTTQIYMMLDTAEVEDFMLLRKGGFVDENNEQERSVRSIKFL